MSFAPTQTALARLHEILTMLEYYAEHVPVGPQAPFEQVLVALDRDLEADAEAAYVMQIFFAEDVMRASGMSTENLDNTATLQLMMTLPVDCGGLSAERRLVTYEALNLLTQAMPFGNLGLNSEKKVYFRYAMVGESQNMNASLVAQLLEMFSFFLTQFGELLQGFVGSDKSVETLMEETGFHKAFAQGQT